MSVFQWVNWLALGFIYDPFTLFCNWFMGTIHPIWCHSCNRFMDTIHPKFSTITLWVRFVLSRSWICYAPRRGLAINLWIRFIPKFLLLLYGYDSSYLALFARGKETHNMWECFTTDLSFYQYICRESQSVELDNEWKYERSLEMLFHDATYE